MATTAGSTALKRREAPSEAPGRPRSRLRVVVARRFSRPSRFRPAHRLAFVAVVLVVGMCLLVASAQAIVASRQIRIDDLRQQLATSVAVNENLEVERAALTAPIRILSIAERKLDMTTPKSVTYLAPVQPTALQPAVKASPK